MKTHYKHSLHLGLCILTVFPMSCKKKTDDPNPSSASDTEAIEFHPLKIYTSKDSITFTLSQELEYDELGRIKKEVIYQDSLALMAGLRIFSYTFHYASNLSTTQDSAFLTSFNKYTFAGWDTSYFNPDGTLLKYKTQHPYQYNPSLTGLTSSGSSNYFSQSSGKRMESHLVNEMGDSSIQNTDLDSHGNPFRFSTTDSSYYGEIVYNQDQAGSFSNDLLTWAFNYPYFRLPISRLPSTYYFVDNNPSGNHFKSVFTIHWTFDAHHRPITAKLVLKSTEIPDEIKYFRFEYGF